MPKLWFRAKRYGYGWYPSSWEGWLVMLGYVILFVTGELLFLRGLRDDGTPVALIAIFLSYIFSITGTLIWIAARTGEKAGWHWGKPKI